MLLVGAGLLQRKGKQTGYAATLIAIAAAGASVWALPASLDGDGARDRGRRDLERSGGASPRSAQGDPVFVYFTADWCLTCKANEAAAIDRREVRAAFTKAGVQVFAGDWTNGDPAITRFLESRDRAGVPLYLWYAPGKPVEELPQILTPGMLISRAQRQPLGARPRLSSRRPRSPAPAFARATGASTLVGSRSTG